MSGQIYAYIYMCVCMHIQTSKDLRLWEAQRSAISGICDWRMLLIAFGKIRPCFFHESSEVGKEKWDMGKITYQFIEEGVHSISQTED